MNNTIKNILSFSLVLAVMGIVPVANAQKGRIAKAKQKHQELAYASSIEIYEELLEKGVDSTEIATDLARSYYEVRDM